MLCKNSIRFGLIHEGPGETGYRAPGKQRRTTKQIKESLMHNRLFSPIEIQGKTLSNRITMAPLYLGYAGEGGAVSALLLEHYRLMAESGASMIDVENATVDHPAGSGSNRTIRIDTDENSDGLANLAETIKSRGALASTQLNHAGRFAGLGRMLAPSAVDTFGKKAEKLDKKQMAEIRGKFAAAAKRAQSAGFDMAELHGGTGYLLAQFVSPRTNKREDEYGGKLKNRIRFPMEVFCEVKSAVGDFPVGYRFMADEWLPDGLKTDESKEFAGQLSEAGAAWLSVVGGTYESFMLDEVVEKSKSPGYMADLAGEIKKCCNAPVITAGRISTGDLAEKIIAEEKADLIGLARVLLADPRWPEKVRQDRESEIIQCDPDCGDICMQLVMKAKPAFCTRWTPEKTGRFKELFE
ncbi:MAG: NADH:flavin oxidoreductase [Desulfobacterales bacterium]